MIIHKNIYNKSQKSIFGFESGITYTSLKHKTTLNVEINGKIYLAHVTDRPLYDANGEKMRI